MNVRQWLKTAETDLFHAVGQAELGKDSGLAQKYAETARKLGRMVGAIEKRFGIKPSRGRRERRGE